MRGRKSELEWFMRSACHLCAMRLNFERLLTWSYIFLLARFNWRWVAQSDQPHRMRVYLQEPTGTDAANSSSLRVAHADPFDDYEGPALQVPDALWSWSWRRRLWVRLQRFKCWLSSEVRRQGRVHDERSKVSLAWRYIWNSNENFSARCISSNDCVQPHCLYGDYSTSAGRCPDKNDKMNKGFESRVARRARW